MFGLAGGMHVSFDSFKHKNTKIACSAPNNYSMDHFSKRNQSNSSRISKINRNLNLASIPEPIEAPFSSPLDVRFKRKCFISLCMLIVSEKLDVRSFQKLYPVPARTLENIIFAWATEADSKRPLISAIFQRVKLLSDFEIRLQIFYAFFITSNEATNEENFRECTNLFWNNSRLFCMFVLCHQSGIQALKQHMRSEGNSENLFFLLLVSEYESIPENLRLKCAKQIMQLFLTDNPGCSIAISFNALTKVLGLISENDGIIPSTLFQDMQKEVFSFILTEPFLRYASSPQCLNNLPTQIFEELKRAISVSEIRKKIK